MRLLINTHKVKLYALIQRMLRDHQASDDVLQSTFIKAWKGLAKFKGDSRLSSWLYRIASNECYTHIEKKKKRAQESLDTVSHMASARLDGPSAEEIQEVLQSAIASLPPKQQLVFNLKYHEGLKYEELAEVTGTSIGALKSSYHIACKKIEVFLVQRSNLSPQAKS